MLMTPNPNLFDLTDVASQVPDDHHIDLGDIAKNRTMIMVSILIKNNIYHNI